MHNNKLKPYWSIASIDEILDFVSHCLALEAEGTAFYERLDEVKQALRDATIAVTPHAYPDGHLITVSWNNKDYPELPAFNKFKVTFDGETSREA